jgi:hypothetical protein
VEQIICVLCNASDEPKATFRAPQARFGVLRPGDTLTFRGDIAHGPERLEKVPIRMLSLIIYGNEDD